MIAAVPALLFSFFFFASFYFLWNIRFTEKKKKKQPWLISSHLISRAPRFACKHCDDADFSRAQVWTKGTEVHPVQFLPHIEPVLSQDVNLNSAAQDLSQLICLVSCSTGPHDDVSVQGLEHILPPLEFRRLCSRPGHQWVLCSMGWKNLREGSLFFSWEMLWSWSSCAWSLLQQHFSCFAAITVPHIVHSWSWLWLWTSALSF